MAFEKELLDRIGRVGQLLRPATVESLKLTELQQQQLQEILAEIRRQVRRALAANRFASDSALLQARDRLTQGLQEMERKVWEILGPQQRAAWSAAAQLMPADAGSEPGPAPGTTGGPVPTAAGSGPG